MRKWLALTLLAVVLLLPACIRTQSQLSIEQLDILLWPEYDRSEMLVIYRILIAPETNFPRQVVLRIPAAAQKPHVVAVGQTPETVTDQGIRYSTRPAGDWIEVVIQAGGPAITLEFYDPTFVRKDIQRQYTYTWPGGYTVRQAFVSLSVPGDATGIITKPALSLQDGALIGSFLNLDAGEQFTLELGYERGSESLQINGGDVQLVETPLGNSWSEKMLVVWPWALGVLGVGLIVGGGLYYWLSGRRKKPTERRRHSAKSGADSGADVHCHQCGRRANPGDRFCRDCGTRLRREV